MDFNRDHFITLWTQAVKEVHHASAAIAADLKEGYRPEHLLELARPTLNAFHRVEDYLRKQ